MEFSGKLERTSRILLPSKSTQHAPRRFSPTMNRSNGSLPDRRRVQAVSPVRRCALQQDRQERTSQQLFFGGQEVPTKLGGNLVELDFLLRIAALSSNGLITAGDVPAQRESTLSNLI